MNIGKRLRELRLAQGLSQGDIVRRTGLLPPYVSYNECGVKTPGIHNLEKWAKALHVPLYRHFVEDLRIRPVKLLTQLSHSAPRLFSFLRRMEDTDRQLWFSIGEALAKQGGKHGGPK